jgi:hypothetical protein
MEWMDRAAGESFRAAETVLEVNFKRTAMVFRDLISEAATCSYRQKGSTRLLCIIFSELRSPVRCAYSRSGNNIIFFFKISIFLLDKTSRPIYIASTKVLPTVEDLRGRSFFSVQFEFLSSKFAGISALRGGFSPGE